MTFKEMFIKERKWYKKVVIMDFYHNLQLYNNKAWKIVDTALYFEISVGQACENIKLAHGVREFSELWRLSRNKALKELRTVTESV